EDLFDLILLVGHHRVFLLPGTANILREEFRNSLSGRVFVDALACPVGHVYNSNAGGHDLSVFGTILSRRPVRYTCRPVLRLLRNSRWRCSGSFAICARVAAQQVSYFALHEGHWMKSK